MPSPLDYLRNAGISRWGSPADSGCLYYPGAYLDTGPLELLLRSRSVSANEPIDSFATAIYVDINITKDFIKQLVDRIKRLFQRNIAIPFSLDPYDFGGLSKEDFFPKLGDPFFDSVPNYADQYHIEGDEFFGIKILFPEIGFALIYLRAEGIQAYRALLQAKVYPNMAVLQDHGVFGFQHATFYGQSLLYKAAKPLPLYLYADIAGDPWPGYERVSTSYVDHGQEHNHARCLYVRKSKVRKVSESRDG